MNIQVSHDEWMQRALALAERGRFSTSPNPRVGCVLVKDNDIIGEGFHVRQGEPHAEVNAIRDAYAQNKLNDLSGVTAYVTLEPCSHIGLTPPCARALIDHKLSCVVIAMQDPNPVVAGRGIQLLEDAGITVITGVQEAQAQRLNRGFCSRMVRARPWVRLKTAASIDGKTAMASGESKWITGENARADTQVYRAQADAIVTGVGTVLADNPRLNKRYVPPEPYAQSGFQPLRVIFDSSLRTPTDAHIITAAGEVLMVYDKNDAMRTNVQAFSDLANVTLYAVAANRSRREHIIDVLKLLAQRGINECHLECGHTLASAFFDAHAVDEWVHYLAACVMGASAQPLIGTALNTMADVARFTLRDVACIGNDVRLTLEPTQHATTYNTLDDGYLA